MLLLLELQLDLNLCFVVLFWFLVQVLLLLFICYCYIINREEGGFIFRDLLQHLSRANNRNESNLIMITTMRKTETHSLRDIWF